MEVLREYISRVSDAVEEAAEGVEAWVLVVLTVGVTLGSITLLDLYRARQDVYQSVRQWVFLMVRRIPAVRREISRQLDQTRSEIENKMFNTDTGGLPPMHALPRVGWTGEEVVAAATKVLGAGKYDWKQGRISGGAFSGTKDALTKLLTEVYGRYALSNPLHSDIFPGVRKMEAEIVKMTLDLFHGDKEACGCMTTGGSESLLLAVKAARDWCREEKGITRPEMVLCYTGHAGFDKAASILAIKLRKVAMDPVTGKVDLRAMRRAITSNTVMLVASAPNFPHGIIDDVEAVGALGQAWNIPVHVDCCMGGFLLPFMEAAGYPPPPFDFRVPGVTSISADTHKYGQAPKGSSVLLYRSPEFLHHQYFVTPNWPGGIYATSGVPGSRAGGLVAVCWAVMLYIGLEGYTTATRDIIATARKLKDQLRQVPEVELFGDPLTSIVAFRTNGVNILTVGDILTSRGWHLTFLQCPPGLHLCLTSLQTREGLVEELVSDLRKAIEDVRVNPTPVEGLGKVYGTAAGIPDKSLLGDTAKMFLGCYYDTLSKPIQTNGVHPPAPAK